MRLKNIISQSCLLAVALYVAGCSGDEGTAPVVSIHSDFQTQVDLFIEEARSRGVSIELDNLILDYDSTLTVGICGKCNSHNINNNGQKVISINPEINCRLTPQQTEALIFHELGHCLLGRMHTGELLPNGDPKSMMVQGNTLLYSECVYPLRNIECSLLFRRTYYIDELFDESTPIPEWAN